ncbi:MAG: sigma-70 family RNA polymerase sigma factor [Pirellulaceae bacterium]|jgi:RNA polymerase sigma-70 factor (ECF subfamily)|nr:sigma-70 family RNA polymerase sigma factor [Pirellulaceae bacterium]MDP7018748.1 sigma-70 family RNA polymerase sigma factor [Pirellulaceae bacterium]
MSASETDSILVERIRNNDTDAWGDLISRYEGRLLAFVESRLSNRGASEDIVQEAFVGFLNSLPNYDGNRPLESYLFSICAYKLTDHLRREGRRPAVPLSAGSDSSGEWQLPGSDRGASSIARSGERQRLEEMAIVEALCEQIERWRERGDWTKFQCIELLIVRGWANKEVALDLDISEQQVANFKFDFLARLRTIIRKKGLSEDVFPELYGD